MTTLIDNQLETLALALASQVAKWNGARSILEPLTAKLVELEIEPRLDGTYSYDIHFSGDIEKLKQVWALLRISGFGLPNGAKRPQANEPDWQGWFHNETCEWKIWVNFASTVCTRVKVGTEMVEQDVYEVRCGEMSAFQD